MQLTQLFKINGLGSASGLIYKNDSLFLIGDSSTYLYEFQMKSKVLTKYPLTENPQDTILKKLKSDFEAITHFENNMYIFGSGSTENRNKMVQVDITTKQVITTFDLNDFYLRLQSIAEIQPEDFNIEGVTFDGACWYFFNRGNGKSNKNIVFTIKGKSLTDQTHILANEYNLAKIKGVSASFTDAVLVDDKIYFLATAEDTKSTYEDGVVVGSLIGCINSNTMELEFTKQITNIHKLEGITLFKKTNSEIEFLLCEDNDTDILESTIYSLKLDLKKN